MINKNNNNTNNRILLVDDEPDITTVFILGLEDNGFRVNAFNDPLQVLSNFKSGLYDLALIDYKMPSMNGFELYREIKKIDDKLKVCFITAFEVYYEVLKKEFQSSVNTTSTSPSSPQSREEKKVNCFIQKPIDVDELVKRIKEVLNS